MGEILVAEQTGLSGFGKRVALKRIKPELAADPDYVRLFLNEARTASLVNHPNVVHVFDVGYVDGALFLVMEYVDGVDMKRFVRRAQLGGQPLAVHEALGVALEVLSALEAAHRGDLTGGAPIIHRDISPENLLVTRGGPVKVLDFGLAKWWPDERAVSAMEGPLIFGKVRYMPPEQLRGGMIDGRADLFALSVVLYEALTGTLPFGRGSANQMLSRILAGPPVAVSELRPDVPASVDALLRRGLAIEAKDRWPDAAAMRAAIVPILDELGVVLPLERLRGRLQRRGAGEASHLPPSERAPAEISLPIARRCGKCGAPSRAWVVDDLILDQCTACHGTWVDRVELDRILGEGRSIEPPPPTSSGPPSLDAVLGSCPVHRVGLTRLQVPGDEVALEVCPICGGMWFDEDELSLLSRGEVVRWLEQELASLAHSHGPPIR